MFVCTHFAHQLTGIYSVVFLLFDAVNMVRVCVCVSVLYFDVHSNHNFCFVKISFGSHHFYRQIEYQQSMNVLKEIVLIFVCNMLRDTKKNFRSEYQAKDMFLCLFTLCFCLFRQI